MHEGRQDRGDADGAEHAAAEGEEAAGGHRRGAGEERPGDGHRNGHKIWAKGCVNPICGKLMPREGITQPKTHLFDNSSTEFPNSDDEGDKVKLTQSVAYAQRSGKKVPTLY